MEIVLNTRNVCDSDRLMIVENGREITVKPKNSRETLDKLHIIGNKTGRVILDGCDIANLINENYNSKIVIHGGTVRNIETVNDIYITDASIKNIKSKYINVDAKEVTMVEKLNAFPGLCKIENAILENVSMHSDGNLEVSISASRIRKILVDTKSANVRLLGDKHVATDIGDIEVKADDDIQFSIYGEVTGDRNLILDRGKECTLSVSNYSGWNIIDRASEIVGDKIYGIVRLSDIGKSKFDKLEITDNSSLLIDILEDIEIGTLDCYNFDTGIISNTNANITILDDVILHKIVDSCKMFDDILGKIMVVYGSKAYNFFETRNIKTEIIGGMPEHIQRKLDKENMLGKSTAQLMIECLDRNSSAKNIGNANNELVKLIKRLPWYKKYRKAPGDIVKVPMYGYKIAVPIGSEVVEAYTGRYSITGLGITEYAMEVAKYYSNIKNYHCTGRLEFINGTVSHMGYGMDCVHAIKDNKNNLQIMLHDLERLLLFDGTGWRIYKAKSNINRLISIQQIDETLDDVIDNLRKLYDIFVNS